MEYQVDNIYNENCYQAIKSIPDKSIDLVYTDIPYDIVGNGGGAFGTKNRDYHKEYEKVSFGFDYSILEEYIRVCKNINVMIWCNKAQILPIMKFFIEKHDCFFDILCWCKTNPIPTCNNKYLSDIEYCLHFRKNEIIRGKYSNKSKFYVSPLNTSDKKLFGHPTIKPMEFVKRHILSATDENAVVLDTFLGSGTTAVACKELNRRYIGFELNEEYFKIAQERLNKINQIEKQEIINIFDFIEEV